MKLSRIQIQNFRNFRALDLRLDGNAVIVGENKIGKSNLLHALRLVLDPTLPDSARQLRLEDFWDGLDRPLTRQEKITVSVELTDFEDDENQFALLSDYLIDDHTAGLTYVFQPLSTLDDEPQRES